MAECVKAAQLDAAAGGQCYFNQGAILTNRGQLDAAIADFNKALKLAPFYVRGARAYTNRAAAYTRQGKLKEALEDATTAMMLDPKMPEAYNVRGEAFMIAGRPKEALKDLNKALENQADLQKLTVAELLGKINEVPEAIRTAVRNNGGGHLNHSMFWKLMKKGGGGEPKGELADAIGKAFNSYGDFRQKFTATALTRFGSGWAWLMLKNGQLVVESSANQDSPVMEGGRPIMGLDVWEHAYYLKYQNRRNEYIESWWHVIDWDQVTRNYQEAL